MEAVEVQTEQIEEQQEPVADPIAIAMVRGEAFTSMPKDLYIPPEALQVFIEAFEGPLDLLLYLIKRQNLDILDIPLAKITAQYMEYVDLMRTVNIELAGDYLLMAAMLAEIKSRMLLPKPKVDDDEPEDPRAELVRRLQEYERFKHAAESLDELKRVDRDFYVASAEPPRVEKEVPKPTVAMEDIMKAIGDVLKRAKLTEAHHISREVLSIRERMSQLLEMVKTKPFLKFNELFTPEEGRMGVVVSFIAMLELIRMSVIELVQTENFGPIHIKALES